MTERSSGGRPAPGATRSPALRATPGRTGRAGRDPSGKRALFTSEPPGDDPSAPLAPARPVDAHSRDVVPLPRPAEVDDLEGTRESDVDHWGRSEHIRSIARTLYTPFYKYWFRAEWEGLEHVPRDGGALLVSNHAGAIPTDAPVIMHGIEEELHRPVYGLAEYLFRSMPVIGTLWSRAGGVAAHPDNAYRLLHDEQQLVLVFPEGTKGTGKTYGDRYRLARFGRGGFVEIAMRAGVPVVPLAVVGSEEAMPMLWNNRRLAKLMGIPYFPVTANMFVFGPLGVALHLPAKVKVRVLPPVSFDVAPDQERYSRGRVMEEAEGIRQVIQDALFDMLRDRRSVWLG